MVSMATPIFGLLVCLSEEIPLIYYLAYFVLLKYTESDGCVWFRRMICQK